MLPYKTNHKDNLRNFTIKIINSLLVTKNYQSNSSDLIFFFFIITAFVFDRGGKLNNK